MSRDRSVRSLCKGLLRSCPYLVPSEGEPHEVVWFVSILALRVLETRFGRRMSKSWRDLLSQPPSLLPLHQAYEEISLPLPIESMPAGLARRSPVEAIAALEDDGWKSAWEEIGGHLFGQVYEALRKSGPTESLPPGFVYTPIQETREIVERALGAWEVHGGSKIPRTLDPGTGCGGFLIEAYRFLTNIRKKPRSKVLHGLHGADLDPAAVRIARLALACEALSPGTPAVSRSLLENTLQVVDVTDNESTMFSRRYDLVIGNPPWVSLKGRFGRPLYTKRALEDLGSRFGIDSYRPNLAEIFVRIALGLLAENGILALLLPDRIAHNLQFQDLRKVLLRETELEEIGLGRRIPDVVSENMILICRNRSPAKGRLVRFFSTDGVSETRQSDLTDILKPSLGKDTALSFGWAKASVPLASLVSTGVGFIPRAGTLTETPEGEGAVPVVRGRDIVRYGRRGRCFFVFEPGSLSGGTTNRAKLGKREKILVRKTGSSLVATLDRHGIYPEQSLYFLHSPKPGVSLSVLLAWLNSKILSDYVRSELLTNPGTIPQIKKVHLDRTPVPIILLRGTGIDEWRDSIESLVEKRLAIPANGSDEGEKKGLEEKIEESVRIRLSKVCRRDR